VQMGARQPLVLHVLNKGVGVDTEKTQEGFCCGKEMGRSENGREKTRACIGISGRVRKWGRGR